MVNGNMNHMPLVSIVTPSFNQGQFIEDTLLSVKNQNYSNIEHIVCDGGSTDNTIDLLKKYEKEYSLKWFSEQDKGQSDAINKGFRRVKGDIVGWLNSDDVYFSKDVFSYVVEEFERNPDVDVIYGDDVFIDANNKVFRLRKILDWNYNKLIRRFSLSQPATFFRINVVKENKLDEKLGYSMDLDFWLRLGKLYKFKHLNRVLAGNRIHSTRKRLKAGICGEEDKDVLKKYGQNFGVSYYVLRYLWDYPDVMIKRLAGIIDIFTIKRSLKQSNLTLDVECPENTLSLIFYQIAPWQLLKLGNLNFERK